VGTGVPENSDATGSHRDRPEFKPFSVIRVEMRRAITESSGDERLEISTFSRRDFKRAILDREVVHRYEDTDELRCILIPSIARRAVLRDELEYPIVVGEEPLSPWRLEVVLILEQTEALTKDLLEQCQDSTVDSCEYGAFRGEVLEPSYLAVPVVVDAYVASFLDGFECSELLTVGRVLVNVATLGLLRTLATR
jgi:hypothetical protein